MYFSTIVFLITWICLGHLESPVCRQWGCYSPYQYWFFYYNIFPFSVQSISNQKCWGKTKQRERKDYYIELVQPAHRWKLIEFYSPSANVILLNITCFHAYNKILFNLLIYFFKYHHEKILWKPAHVFRQTLLDLCCRTVERLLLFLSFLACWIAFSKNSACWSLSSSSAC